MIETWRPIPGIDPWYEASSLGRIRSKGRRDASGKHRRTRVLSPVPDRKGYLRVRLGPVGQRRTYKVHHLILEAFAGPRPVDMEACHNDGDNQNNAASNLRWDTRSSNTFDSVRLGVHPQASKTHCPQGHPYDDANTYRYNGARHCRTCMQRRRLEYRTRKAAA